MGTTLSKMTGNHTSLTPSGKTLANFAESDPRVWKIAAGFIRAGLRPLKSGHKRIKITHNDGYLLCKVRGNTSIQDVHLYASEPQDFIQDLQKSLGKKFKITVQSTT